MTAVWKIKKDDVSLKTVSKDSKVMWKVTKIVKIIIKK